MNHFIDQTYKTQSGYMIMKMPQYSSVKELTCTMLIEESLIVEASCRSSNSSILTDTTCRHKEEKWHFNKPTFKGFNNNNRPGCWNIWIVSRHDCPDSPPGVCVADVGSWKRGWTPWSRRGDTTGPLPSHESGGRASAACTLSGTSYRTSRTSMSFPLWWERGKPGQSSTLNTLM